MKRLLVLKKLLFMLLLLAALPLFAQGTQDDTVWTKHLFPDNIVDAKFTKNSDNIIILVNESPLNPSYSRVYNFITESGLLDWEINLNNYSIDPQVTCMSVSKTANLFVIGTMDGKVALFNYDAKDTLWVKNLINGIWDIEFSADGNKIYCVIDNDGIENILELDAAAGETMRRTGDDGENKLIAVSEDGMYLLSYSIKNAGEWNHRVKLWDAETYTEICELGQHDNDVMDLDFSPDGKYAASAGEDGKAKVWSIEQKNLIKNIEHQSGYSIVSQCSFSRDSKYLITGGGGVSKAPLKIWNLDNWENTYIYPHPYGASSSLQVSVDNNYILSTSAYNLYLLNAKWEPISVEEKMITEMTILYPNPTDNIVTIAFTINSPDIILIKIINESGNVIETLHNGMFEAGEHKLKWNSSGFPSGIYFCRIEGRNINNTFKIIVNH